MVALRVPFPIYLFRPPPAPTVDCDPSWVLAQVACLFAMLVKEMGEHGPHLVVTPASTVDNWVRELGKWCPTLNVVKYGGTKDARAEFLDRDRFPRGTNVVVTTYTYFSRNDCKQDRKFLSRQGWTYLVRFVRRVAPQGWALSPPRRRCCV
jgi:hypothetical protein